MGNNNSLVYRFESMEDCSAQIKSVINHLEAAKTSLEALNDHLNMIWRGDAQVAFSEQCIDLFKQIDKMDDSLKERNANLEIAITKMRDTEGEIGKDVGKMSGNNIF